MSASEIAAAARDYMRRGWSVIPLRPASKLPAIRWDRHQRAHADEAAVQDWVRRWPDLNIGIVTGAVSGLVVVDIDRRHDGVESLAALERLYGPLPSTVEAVTGGGGRHLYFAAPPTGLRNRAGVAAGVDLRGEGGMVVAPPSIHPSGGRYRWRPGHEPGALPLAVLPHWLIRLAGDRPAGQGHGLAHWRALVREGVEEGRRNNTIASFAGHLLWHGVDAEIVLELMLCWNRQRCRPPLDDGEVAQVVASITHLHEDRSVPESGAF
ncbi:MAG TPA: bifunctional DNA primase/polymerase [Stellaceae bacterium]|nr:bifunctional DNA primase/polymerase [Stellaceae bacterium]